MPQDQPKLVALMHFEHHVHRHLDWVSPINYLDVQPFLVIEQDGIVQAALACPVDPPGVAWIRLFLASGSVSYEAMWQLLWSEVRKQLNLPGGIKVAAIALHQWLAEMLERSKFHRVQEVVFLTWTAPMMFKTTLMSIGVIRPMEDADLPAILAVDEAAFGQIWRNSLDSLTAAYEQSCIATVIEIKGKVVGYQISTIGHMGGHLARLAVHPDYQGKYCGHDLLVDVLRKFLETNVTKVSVNTQQENFVSLGLYQKVGFRRTGESYGVYQYDL